MLSRTGKMDVFSNSFSSPGVWLDSSFSLFRYLIAHTVFLYRTVATMTVVVVVVVVAVVVVVVVIVVVVVVVVVVVAAVVVWWW